MDFLFGRAWRRVLRVRGRLAGDVSPADLPSPAVRRRGSWHGARDAQRTPPPARREPCQPPEGVDSPDERRRRRDRGLRGRGRRASVRRRAGGGGRRRTERPAQPDRAGPSGDGAARRRAGHGGPGRHLAAAVPAQRAQAAEPQGPRGRPGAERRRRRRPDAARLGGGSRGRHRGQPAALPGVHGALRGRPRAVPLGLAVDVGPLAAASHRHRRPRRARVRPRGSRATRRPGGWTSSTRLGGGMPGLVLRVPRHDAEPLRRVLRKPAAGEPPIQTREQQRLRRPRLRRLPGPFAAALEPAADQRGAADPRSAGEPGDPVRRRRVHAGRDATRTARRRASSTPCPG